MTRLAVSERVFGIAPFTNPIKSGAWTEFLIIGEAGGVGTVAVQLAAAEGAAVIAPALPEEQQFVRSLGAMSRRRSPQ